MGKPTSCNQLQDPDKQRAVGTLLGSEVESTDFADLVALGKMFVDYQAPVEAAEEGGGQARLCHCS